MDNPYEELKGLISSKNKNEILCRKYLKHTPQILFNKSVIALINFDEEDRGSSGDSDYVISGIVKNDAGSEYNLAYIWEVKAAQCYIFEEETKNRLKPSSDLVKAENQLINYYNDKKGDEKFRNRFKITHSNFVKIGGIIIGSNKTLIKSKKIKSKQTFLEASSLRENTLYKSPGIRLIIWDTILDQLKNQEYNNKTENGKIKNISIPNAQTANFIKID